MSVIVLELDCAARPPRMTGRLEEERAKDEWSADPLMEIPREALLWNPAIRSGVLPGSGQVRHLGRDTAAGLAASGGGSARRTAGAVRGRRADSSIVSLRSGGSRDSQRPAAADRPRAARLLQRTHSGRPYTAESAVGVGSAGSNFLILQRGAFCLPGRWYRAYMWAG